MLFIPVSPLFVRSLGSLGSPLPPVLRPSFTRIGYGEDMTGEPEVDAINFIIRDTKWIL